MNPAATRVHICSFSSNAAELPKGKRSASDVLEALRISPRISTFDMSEHSWLADAIHELRRDGKIKDVAEPYPWHRFEVIE